MTRPVAILILQRNLPDATDALVEQLMANDANKEICDVYVIESGSDKDKLSKHCTFWANWPEAIEKGLHYCRGMNYGLSELQKIKSYKYYFMLTGDAKCVAAASVAPLVALMDEYQKIGILSPLFDDWGADVARNDKAFSLQYLMPHVAWMFRHEFLEKIIDHSEPQYMHYFYDGDNMRGYDADTELIVKAYQHDYCVATTPLLKMYEDHDLMARNAARMKTDAQQQHRKLMYEEGLAWMKKKYGYNNKNEFRRASLDSLRSFLRANKEYQEFCKI